MSDAIRNVLNAHARVQAELAWLVLVAGAGYDDPDPRGRRRRLSKDCQDVIDAAIDLKRVVMSDGAIEPRPMPGDAGL